MSEFICIFCGKVCSTAGGKTNHEKQCQDNPNKIIRKLDTGIKHYNLYLQDNSIAWGQKNMQCYKKYFLEEQDHKCAICGCLDTWQNMPLMFVLDHVDGNADNNNRDNLRLVCPNCDSQLDTFKSKNKHSARAKYRNIKVVSEEEYEELAKQN